MTRDGEQPVNNIDPVSWLFSTWDVVPRLLKLDVALQLVQRDLVVRTAPLT